MIPDTKLYFSDKNGERVILLADQCSIAVIPNGTKIRMQGPVVLNGGAHLEYAKRDKGTHDLTAARVEDMVATYNYGVLNFPNERSVQVREIRHGNWGTVVEVPA